MDRNALRGKSQKWQEREGREIISVNSEKAFGRGRNDKVTFARWGQNHRPSKYVEKLKENSLRQTKSTQDARPKEYLRKSQPSRLPPLKLAKQTRPIQTNTQTDMDKTLKHGLLDNKTKLPPIKASLTPQPSSFNEKTKDRLRFLTKTLSSSDVKTAALRAKSAYQGEKPSRSSLRKVESSSSTGTKTSATTKQKSSSGRRCTRSPASIGVKSTDGTEQTHTSDSKARWLPTSGQSKSENRPQNKSVSKTTAASEANTGYIHEKPISTINTRKFTVSTEDNGGDPPTKSSFGCKRKYLIVPVHKTFTEIGNTDPSFDTVITKVLHSKIESNVEEPTKTKRSPAISRKSLPMSNEEKSNGLEKKLSSRDINCTDLSSLQDSNTKRTAKKKVVGIIRTTDTKSGELIENCNTDSQLTHLPDDQSQNHHSSRIVTANLQSPAETGPPTKNNAGESEIDKDLPNQPLNAWELIEVDSGEYPAKYRYNAKPVTSDGGSVEILKFYRDNFPLLLQNIDSTENFPCMPKRCQTPEFGLQKPRYYHRRKTLAELEAALSDADIASGNVGIEILRKSHGSNDFKRRMAGRKR